MPWAQPKKISKKKKKEGGRKKEWREEKEERKKKNWSRNVLGPGGTGYLAFTQSVGVLEGGQVL